MYHINQNRAQHGALDERLVGFGGSSVGSLTVDLTISSFPLSRE
jgi:hypothetical protein